MRHADIVLTEEELGLLSQINFNSESYDDFQSFKETMALLAKRLLGRGAIPKVRIDYFTEPGFNPGGRGKSRQDVFEKNGTSGDEILCHPNFLKHLEYFIFGPDLPSAVIDKFRSQASFSLSGGDIDDLAPYARSCLRSYGLIPHDAAEEFYKLAVECGAMPDVAETVRSSVRAVKVRL